MSQAACLGLDLLSPSEVAGLLKVSRASVYTIAGQNLLPAFRVGRQMRFRKEDIVSYLERNPYVG